MFRTAVVGHKAMDDEMAIACRRASARSSIKRLVIVLRWFDSIAETKPGMAILKKMPAKATTTSNSISEYPRPVRRWPVRKRKSLSTRAPRIAIKVCVD